ncbi:MAG: YdcH family protein [Acidobacteria bacterium]|nr:YdcH family protein [Acidobacteriota bacterium]
MDIAEVKDYLARTDQEFRALAEKHQEYERQLQELLSKPYLSEQEQLQETVIKKKKLALKDQMQLLIQRYRSQESVQ